MKLIEFVQEGVFDKVKAKPSVKMRLKDLTQSNVQRLSDEEFHEQLEHFAPRRDRIWRSVSEINKKIREVRKFSNDFTNTKGKKGFARDPHSGFKDRWVRVGSEGERLVDKLEGESEVYSQKYGEYSKIGVILVSEKRRRDTLRKKEGRKQAAGNWPDFQEKHPENTPSTIPPKIARTSGLKPSLANPYFGRKGCALEKQYAGHPAHYPYWSNDWKRRIIAVDELLTRNGKQGLELMYAGTFFNGGNRFNFMIIGAGGNFLWRKYDPSPGAGQNHVYLNGKKMKTSDLENMMTGSSNHVDSMIKTL